MPAGTSSNSNAGAPSRRRRPVRAQQLPAPSEPNRKNVRPHHQHTKPTQALPLDQDGGAETDQTTTRPREGRLGDELGDVQQVHTQLTVPCFFLFFNYTNLE